MTYTSKAHEPCASRGDCFHARGGRNQPREVKVCGGRKGACNQPREAKVRGGRNRNKLHGNPGTSEGRAKGGRIGGRSGSHEDKVRAGRKGAHKRNKLHGNPGTSESCAKGGRNGSYEYKVRAGRIGGRIGGRKNVESGHLARISRGVESVTEDGIHCDSQTEAIFYGVMTALGGKPARAASVVLPDGRSYTPDFVLGKSVLGIPAKIPIELKPSRKMFPRFNTTVKKAEIIGAVIIYADEIWD